MTGAQLNPKAVLGLFRWLTPRGWSFAGAGGAAIAVGLLIPEADLVRVGVLLAFLPVVSAVTTLRPRNRLSCARRLDPPRATVGQPVAVTTRVENASRLRTGVLLAEDITPSALGSPPRFVLDEIEPGGLRVLSYQVRAQARGKFTIGPLRVRFADAFGLVETGRSVGASSAVVVTPRIFPLPQLTGQGSQLGEGEGAIAAISAIGEDDAGARAYRHGDGLHRVHWKSTARHGKLMVRAEERQCRQSASVFLDTRRSAHSGAGHASTFEFAVSAAASIGARLLADGVRARLITGADHIAPGSRGSGQEDTLLDVLAVVSPSLHDSLRPCTSALASASGLLIAVVGRLSTEDARELAASRPANAQPMALLAVPDLGSAIEFGHRESEDTARAAEILIAAGWRVAAATASTPLAGAWEQLHRAAGQPLTRTSPAASGGWAS
jgi:uncharacterized protein (DUF58 family)